MVETRRVSRPPNFPPVISIKSSGCQILDNAVCITSVHHLVGSNNTRKLHGKDILDPFQVSATGHISHNR